MSCVKRLACSVPKLCAVLGLTCCSGENTNCLGLFLLLFVRLSSTPSNNDEISNESSRTVMETLTADAASKSNDPIWSNQQFRFAQSLGPPAVQFFLYARFRALGTGMQSNKSNTGDLDTVVVFESPRNEFGVHQRLASWCRFLRRSCGTPSATSSSWCAGVPILPSLKKSSRRL